MFDDETAEFIDAVSRCPRPDGEDPEELAKWYEVNAYALNLVYHEQLRSGAPVEEIDEVVSVTVDFANEARRLRRGT